MSQQIGAGSRAGSYWRFKLGQERGVVLARLIQYMKKDWYGHIAPVSVPDMPSFMVGVVTFRGQLVPIVDLRRLWGLPPEELTVSPAVIFAKAGCTQEGGAPLIGIVVDEVRELSGLDDEHFRPLPAGVSKPGAVAVSEKDRLVALVLDPDKLFAAAKLAAMRFTIIRQH